FGTGEQQRALEAELAQLVRDGVEHVAAFGLAAQARGRSGERAQVLARARQVGQRALPAALLGELERCLVPDAAQRAEQGTPGLAIEHQPEHAGRFALYAERYVRAPPHCGSEAAQVERVGDLRRASRQMD